MLVPTGNMKAKWIYKHNIIWYDISVNLDISNVKPSNQPASVTVKYMKLGVYLAKPEW